jgi:hypothetical protein
MGNGLNSTLLDIQRIQLQGYRATSKSGVGVSPGWSWVGSSVIHMASSIKTQLS